MTFIYAVFYYLNYASIYSSLAISVLRVAAVLKPIESDQLQLQLSRILVLVVYLLPVLTTWFLIPAQAYFTPISNSASLGIDYEKVYPQWRSSLAMVFVTSITCFLDFSCFAVTITKWRTLSRKMTQSNRRSEKSLLFLGCSICLSLCLNCVLQFFFFYMVYLELSFLIRGFVYDVLVFVPTWVFYLTHPSFKSTSSEDAVSVVSPPKSTKNKY
ncbi:hypothetical protein Y032_0075g970 [Ancylostoma ceylanicum]|nr:hypothetical protein Y032_0075g970 [Ancylostoma ceylanicum]